MDDEGVSLPILGSIRYSSSTALLLDFQPKVEGKTIRALGNKLFNLEM